LNTVPGRVIELVTGTYEPVLSARREPLVKKFSAKIEPAEGYSSQNSGPLPVPSKAFNSWTLEALRTLEGKRFERLCAKYYEAVGFQSETLCCGADDLDLVKFFDWLNHDILMSWIARKVKDEKVLKLIRRYLEAGMMFGGIVSARTKGTPSGGAVADAVEHPVVTDLDRELERWGHQFWRNADDSNIYVRTEAAGRPAMAAITDYLEKKLKLQVSRDKSAVAGPWKPKFLGYSVTWHKQVRLKIADTSLTRLKDRVRVKSSSGMPRATSAKRLHRLTRCCVAGHRTFVWPR
jgi:hypothetical protein